MKKSYVRIFSLILSIIIIGTFSIVSSAYSLSEDDWIKLEKACSTPAENFSWTFDENTGVLSVSGNGAMPIFDEFDNESVTLYETPWLDLYDKITKIVVEEGITYISSGSFNGLTNVTNVVLPESLLAIGIWAFKWCTSLELINIPDSVMFIGEQAFGTTSLKKVIIPDMIAVDSTSFLTYTIEEIYVPENIELFGGSSIYLTNSPKVKKVVNKSTDVYAKPLTIRGKFMNTEFASKFVDVNMSAQNRLIESVIKGESKTKDECYVESAKDILGVTFENADQFWDYANNQFGDSIAVYYCLAESVQEKYCIENSIEYINITADYTDEEVVPPTEDSEDKEENDQSATEDNSESKNDKNLITEFFEMVMAFINNIIEWFKNIF